MLRASLQGNRVGRRERMLYSRGEGLPLQSQKYVEWQEEAEQNLYVSSVYIIYSQSSKWSLGAHHQIILIDLNNYHLLSSGYVSASDLL